MLPCLDRRPFDDLFSLVYEELRRLARSVVRQEYAVQVTPTTLVNEAWLKMAERPEVAETSPLHFRRIAARAMRQILVDLARRRQAEKHGAGLVRVTFDAAVDGSHTIRDRDILALDEALEILGRRSPRQALLVEARFFGGLDNAQCAELLGTSVPTVVREWRVARAWLAAQIHRSCTGAVAESSPALQEA